MVGNSWSLPEFSPMDSIGISVCLTTYDGKPKAFMSTPLQEMVDQIEAGTLPVSIGKMLKLDEVVEAHRAMEETRAGGKIVMLALRMESSCRPSHLNDPQVILDTLLVALTSTRAHLVLFRGMPNCSHCSDTST